MRNRCGGEIALDDTKRGIAGLDSRNQLPRALTEVWRRLVTNELPEQPVEAQRHREKALPVIEWVGQRVIEAGVENELGATQQPAFLLLMIHEHSAIALATILGIHG